MQLMLFILDHNTPEMADPLFLELTSHLPGNCDVAIIDNGSSNCSKYAKYKLGKNCLWDGGLNAALSIFNEPRNRGFTHMGFWNSDIWCYGGVLPSLMSEDCDVLSPSVIEPISDRSPFCCMRPHYTGGVRAVPMIEFVAPILSRRAWAAAGMVPSQIIAGWGYDMLACLRCAKAGYSAFVSDLCSVTHLKGYSVKQLKSDVFSSEADYKGRALAAMNSYIATLPENDRSAISRMVATATTYQCTQPLHKKAALDNVSICIPVRYDADGVRAARLRALLDHIQRYFSVSDILLIEHDSESRHPAWLTGVSGLTTVLLRSKGPFSRSAAVNEGIRRANKKKIVILDTDVLFDPNTLVSVNNDAAAGTFTVLFSQFIDVKAEVLGYPIPYKECLKPENHLGVRMGNSLLGGKVYSAAIVLSQEVIAKIGYFDEEFSGWGCEDDEYVIRANRLKVPIVVCSGNLYHISHAPAADKRADLHAKNSELLHRLIKLPIEDLKKRHNLP